MENASSLAVGSYLVTNTIEVPNIWGFSSPVFVIVATGEEAAVSGVRGALAMGVLLPCAFPTGFNQFPIYFSDPDLPEFLLAGDFRAAIFTPEESPQPAPPKTWWRGIKNRITGWLAIWHTSSEDMF